MSHKRHDFSSDTKKIVRKETLHICQKCFLLSPDNGQVSHICAASKNGPRYDPNQTKEERIHRNNAMFLCTPCAKEVDNNPSLYTSIFLVVVSTNFFEVMEKCNSITSEINVLMRENAILKKVNTNLEQENRRVRTLHKRLVKEKLAIETSKEISEEYMEVLAEENEILKEQYEALLEEKELAEEILAYQIKQSIHSAQSSINATGGWWWR